MTIVKPHIAFAIPAYGKVDAEVLFSIVRSYHHVLNAGADATLSVYLAPRVDVARNELVLGCLELNPTHIMWLDSDVLVPEEGVVQLFQHKQAVVSGLYHYKNPPFAPVVYDVAPFQKKAALDSLTELHPVGGVGMGCCLVVADLYRAMSKYFKDQLWYDLQPDVGEDVHFFQRLHKMGVPTFLDPTVRCGHMRSAVTTFDDWDRQTQAVTKLL